MKSLKSAITKLVDPVATIIARNSTEYKKAKSDAYGAELGLESARYNRRIGETLKNARSGKSGHIPGQERTGGVYGNGK